ncbi:hypothetical protein J2T13_002992 [Paenibacillus sp. DS2015]
MPTSKYVLGLYGFKHASYFHPWGWPSGHGSFEQPLKEQKPQSCRQAATSELLCSGLNY